MPCDGVREDCCHKSINAVHSSLTFSKKCPIQLLSWYKNMTYQIMCWSLNVGKFRVGIIGTKIWSHHVCWRVLKFTLRYRLTLHASNRADRTNGTVEIYISDRYTAQSCVTTAGDCRKPQNTEHFGVRYPNLELFIAWLWRYFNPRTQLLNSRTWNSEIKALFSKSVKQT